MKGRKLPQSSHPPGPPACYGLTCVSINPLEECGHSGELLSPARRRAGSEDLTATAIVLRPVGDPMPAARKLAFLQAAALEAAARDCPFRDKGYLVHGDLDHSIRIGTDRVLFDQFSNRGPIVFGRASDGGRGASFDESWSEELVGALEGDGNPTCIWCPRAMMDAGGEIVDMAAGDPLFGWNGSKDHDA